ncbi:MAG TPA: hypothetical protein VGE12_06010 [Noviherbaspirillum sp.]
MYQRTLLATTLAALFGTSMPAHADDAALAQLREELRQMKQDYEARIKKLETRLQAAESQASTAGPSAPVATASPVASAARTGNANAFNPEISLILGGTYANLSQDPSRYRIQGFIPGGEEIGPGNRSFNLGESEMTLRANIDPYFSGQLTFGLSEENEAEVEEAFFQTSSLSHGFRLKGGRFLSAIGYQNSQHAHTWDFVDLPLAYQAMLGGQYRPDGAQLKWLAPTDRFLEFGAELGDGAAFPGSDRNKNGVGSGALFARTGDDLGASASWQAGVSWLKTRATDRTYEDSDAAGIDVTNAFSGRSNTWIVDGVYKWAPGGNASRTSFKLQGEYFRRKETGTLTYDTFAQSLGTAADAYASAQSGWYVQGVYQFRPMWRAGLRYDRLDSRTPEIGLISSGALTAADFQQLASFNPSRTSVMLDYSPSEFSRLRLQLARDKSRPDASDNQLFLQYIMSLGAHGGHAF